MVKVSMEVRKGASRFTVAVRAESLHRAVSLVRGRYPSGDCRLLYPVNPEGFVAADPARAEAVERLTGMAA